MKSVKCPNCGAIRFKPDGMCCNSGKDSGSEMREEGTLLKGRLLVRVFVAQNVVKKSS
jgi:uncharacterized OB-fold protein